MGIFLLCKLVTSYTVERIVLLWFFWRIEPPGKIPATFSIARHSTVHCPITARSTSMARKTALQAAEDQIKDQAFSELQSLIEESEKLLKSSASLVGEEAETLRGQIALKLQQARDSVTNVRQRAIPAVDATENYIGGHPWQTVAVSAGFGLVVGMLLARR
jgi:ElaB/YqjD/DUF883 family membrane-anchored ribosome-binding protein